MHKSYEVVASHVTAETGTGNPKGKVLVRAKEGSKTSKEKRPTL